MMYLDIDDHEKTNALEKDGEKIQNKSFGVTNTLSDEWMDGWVDGWSRELV
jgi:hypothetical protein